ncbi:hypothetical protein ABZ924_28230 [Streptomyces sp. NPDC046876]|uniref:hypothetical protein n=1 Tax=Streptomyces sp. NPDC046876 TaxID=3155616 RepID=UPI0033E2E044
MLPTTRAGCGSGRADTPLNVAAACRGKAGPCGPGGATRNAPAAAPAGREPRHCPQAGRLEEVVDALARYGPVTTSPVLRSCPAKPLQEA